MQLLKKVAIAAWVLSIPIGTRYIFGGAKEFGELQYLEYTSTYVAAASFAHLLVLGAFWRTALKLLSSRTALMVCLMGILSVVATPLPTTSLMWLIFLSLWLISLSVVVVELRRSEALRKTFFITLVVAGTFELILGILQFAIQHSVGLTLLGEPVANRDTLGVAKVVQQGQKLMRPLGTFPHANVFGGFLVTYFLALLSQSNKKSPFNPLFIQVLLGIAGIGIFFSFSRAAWITLMILIIASLFRGRLKLIVPGLVAIAACSMLFGPSVADRFAISEQAVQFDIRSVAQRGAIDASLQSPLGLGLRGFIPYLLSQNSDLPTYYYQPAHNGLLHVLAELGTPLVVAAIVLVAAAIARNRAPGHSLNWTAVLAAGPLLLLDHYLVTLPQGIGILGLLVVLSLVPRASSEPKLILRSSPAYPQTH